MIPYTAIYGEVKVKGPIRTKYRRNVLPRHWKKKESCRRRSCQRRDRHWHWEQTFFGAMESIKKDFWAEMQAQLMRPGPLWGLIDSSLRK